MAGQMVTFELPERLFSWAERTAQVTHREMETVLAPVFGHITNTFVDAFVRRADEVYAL